VDDAESVNKKEVEMVNIANRSARKEVVLMLFILDKFLRNHYYQCKTQSNYSKSILVKIKFEQ